MSGVTWRTTNTPNTTKYHSWSFFFNSMRRCRHVRHLCGATVGCSFNLPSWKFQPTNQPTKRHSLWNAITTILQWNNEPRHPPLPAWAKSATMTKRKFKCRTELHRIRLTNRHCSPVTYQHVDSAEQRDDATRESRSKLNLIESQRELNAWISIQTSMLRTTVILRKIVPMLFVNSS